MYVDADPAERAPPTTVAATSPSEGIPRSAKNITGTVVSSNSSITRGFVSPTYAATTSLKDACSWVVADGSPVDKSVDSSPPPEGTAAEADWPTCVTVKTSNTKG